MILLSTNSYSQDVKFFLYKYKSVEDRFAMNYKEFKDLYRLYKNKGDKITADSSVTRQVLQLLKITKSKPLLIFIMGRSDWVFVELEQNGKIIPYWLSVSLVNKKHSVLLMSMDKRSYYKFENAQDILFWVKALCLSNNKETWSDELKEYVLIHNVLM
jgi:hypothetical protein